MIIFITDSARHQVKEVVDRLTIMEGKAGIAYAIQIVSATSELGYDLETTSVDALTGKILLRAIGTPTIQIVVDVTTVDDRELLLEVNKRLLVGQNLKFDYSFTKTNDGIELEHLYDTMIVEQRLFANLFNPKDKPFSLDSIIQRYTGYIPKTMYGNIRGEFVGANPKTFIFENRHVEYSAGDVGTELFEVKKKQIEYIKKYGMTFLIYQIEMPLIRILANSELEGIDLDTDKLRELIEVNKEKKYEYSVKLDNIFKQLRDDYATKENKLYISGGSYDSNRIKPRADNTISLFDVSEFGTTVASKGKKKAKKKVVTNSINWSSSDEVIFIFGRCGFVLPNESGQYRIPMFNEKNVLINQYEGFTTGEKAIEQYTIDNANSPTVEFLNTLIDYREVTTELTKYGEDFANKISSVTGRIHTLYRQATAINGRLQSGGGRESQSDKINIQNVPAKKDFRHLFYRKGYKIITCDLAGAEATILADKAGDMRLVELVKGDIHSYMVQKGWRRIFTYRAKSAADMAKGLSVFDEDEYGKLKVVYEKNRELAETFTVSKTVNAIEYRKPGKNLTFGAIYGCAPPKAAKTISCSKEEAIIYLDTQREEIPLTYALVDRNAETAIRMGYLVLNHRTNSRVWFPKAIEAIKERRPIDFMSQIEVDGQARNVPISGTQADMLKEAMVVIDKHIRDNKIDAILLMQVHDELVYAARPQIAEEFGNYVKQTMCQVADSYLTHIKMGASLSISDTWEKD